MKALIYSLLILVPMAAAAQKTYTVVYDKQLQQPIYNGLVTLAQLEHEPAFDWLQKGESAYEPDAKTIASLRTKLPDYTMVVFLGTWCGDSRNLIPKFAKVLRETGYPEKNLTIYCVDMEKKTTNGRQDKYGITNVPTFILYRNGKEAGRIVESVPSSIEASIAAIMTTGPGKDAER